MAQPGVCVGSVYGRRIVFYGAAEDVSEPTLLQLFSQHGDVTGLFVVRSALGLPCGCGYVTMATAEQASAAATALSGTSDCAEPGTKLGLLIIQTATTSSSGSQAHDSQPGSPTEAAGSRACSQQSPRTKDSRSVFFTKVPPTVTAHQLIQLFTSCGEVLHLELFTPWPGAKISKGCGLVEFASPDAAAAAVHSLHHAFTWPHSHSPLIVEWVDSNRQSANRAHKARSAAAAAASEQGSVRRAPTAPTDGRKLPAMGGGYMAHPGQPGTAMYAAAMQHQQQLARLQQQQQHLNSHSCPLPQGHSWAAGGHAGMAGGIPWSSPSAFSNSAVLPTVAVQGGSDGSAGYRTPGSSSLDGSGFSHHQAVQRDGNHLWWPMQQPQQPQRNGYDALNAAPHSTLSSTSSNLGQPSPPAYGGHSLETSLQACSAAGYSGELCDPIGPFPASGSGLAGSPTLRCSEPALAVAAAAALEAGGVDLGWQQLQAQNVMLLQPMGNPVDEVAATMAERVLLPATTAGLVEERQRQALQMSSQPQQYPVWHQYPPSPQVQQLLQQQQAQTQQRQLAAAAQQQQHWWAAQQQQQQVAGDEAAMVLLLSARQLSAMPQVLQEVARMTGAKACLTGAVDGSVQLLLTGRLVEVQTAHSVAGMLLAKVGVDEPLLQRSH